MSAELKRLDELLVHGYIRIFITIQIPDDVINACFNWYHIDSYFLIAGTDCTINDDKHIVSAQNMVRVHVMVQY